MVVLLVSGLDLLGVGLEVGGCGYFGDCEAWGIVF